MDVTAFGSVNDTHGKEFSISIDELDEYVGTCAINSIQVENLPENKKCQPVLLGGNSLGDNPQQPELRRRRLQDIISRSLLALDIEPKNGQVFTIENVNEWLEELGLGAILYTTFSSVDGDRCRAFIEIGEDVDSDERYEQLVQWLIEKCPKQHTIDRKSLDFNQVMALPTAYAFDKPKTFNIKGLPLNKHLMWEESKQLHTRNRNKQHQKPNKLSNQTNHLSDEKYMTLVKNQWNELKPAHRYGNSWQFYRNDKDKNPGLYSLSDMDAVIDEVKSKYRTTFYSANDIAEALGADKKPDDPPLYQALRWEESERNCAIFSENTGSGKSKTLVALANRKDGTHRIITFPNRKLRNDFDDWAPDTCITIYGNEEIVQMATGYRAETKVKNEFTNFFEYCEETDSRLDFQKFINGLNFLKPEEVARAMMMYKKNKEDMLRKDKPLLMTHDKLEGVTSYSGEHWNPFLDSIVYSDEYRMGTVVYNETGKDTKKIRQLKRMYISAERLALIELENNFMFPIVIGKGIKKMYDDGLTVLRLKSTRIADDTRKSLYSSLSKHHSTVIANSCDSDWNLVNNKGTNKLRLTELCTILSYPDPVRLNKAKRCLKIDDDDVVRELLVSSDASQAIGRNLGNRNDVNGTNRHIILLPENLPCKPDIVTTNVYRLNDWINRGGMLGEYFSGVINDITGIAEAKLRIHDIEPEVVLAAIGENDVIPSSWLAEELRVGVKILNKIAIKIGLKVQRRTIHGKRVRCILR